MRRAGLRRSRAVKNSPAGARRAVRRMPRQFGGVESLAGATFKDRLRVVGLLAARRAGLVLRAACLGGALAAAIGLGRRPPEAAADRAAGYPHKRSDPRGGYLCRLFRFRRQDRQRAWPLAFRAGAALGGMGARAVRALAGCAICAPPIRPWHAPMRAPSSMIF